MNLTSKGMPTAGKTPQVLAGATDKTLIIVTQSCSELIVEEPSRVWGELTDQFMVTMARLTNWTSEGEGWIGGDQPVVDDVSL